MGTFTALILAGQNHTYDGGMINLSHQLFLSENGVARWNLYAFDFSGSIQSEAGIMPHPDTILEDGLMFVGLRVWRDEKLRQAAERLCPKWEKEPQQLFTNPETASELRRICREMPNYGKLLINVFDGSSVRNQLQVLEQYKFEVEVCVSIYHKFQPFWSNDLIEEGTLNRDI